MYHTIFENQYEINGNDTINKHEETTIPEQKQRKKTEMYIVQSY